MGEIRFFWLLLFASVVVACAPAYASRPSELFGQREQYHVDAHAFKKWSDLLTRQKKLLPIPPTLESESKILRGVPQTDAMRTVNDRVNGLRYMTDLEAWSLSDYWATFQEFLEKGAGDCEDYAIGKYTWLKYLGVPKDNLRISIVLDAGRGRAHAVLTVRMGEKTYVLDNQNPNILNVSSVGNYIPLYSINEEGWWSYNRSAFVSALRDSPMLHPRGAEILGALYECLGANPEALCYSRIPTD